MKYIVGQRFEHEQIWYSGFHAVKCSNLATLLTDDLHPKSNS